MNKLDVTPERRKEIEANFWKWVDKSGDCWVWTGALSTKGYANFSIWFPEDIVRRFYGHRFSWFLIHGEIPKGMLICHHCDNRPCVRPDHLFLGTAKDNAMDAIKKGRFSPRKDSHP